jgi:hypothetical protein
VLSRNINFVFSIFQVVQIPSSPFRKGIALTTWVAEAWITRWSCNAVPLCSGCMMGSPPQDQPRTRLGARIISSQFQLRGDICLHAPDLPSATCW